MTRSKWQAGRGRRLLRQASALLTMAQEEMQTYADARSDHWQESERGEAFADRLEALQEVQPTLDDLEA